MSDIQKHKATQEAFAAHIRNPEKHPKPNGIDDHRMQVYRDLFFNNINGLISQAFPVLASLHSRKEWAALIRGFYQKQNNKTPYFTEIATEFLEFLKRQPDNTNRPFIYELAHYEWLEMVLEKEPHMPQYQVLDGHQLRTQIPIVTPLIRIQKYHYPVHQIRSDFQPTQADGPHHLMVWRIRNQQIKFAQLNDISKQLLDQLQMAQRCGEEAILFVFKKNHLETTEQAMTFGYQQLFKWHQQDIIINIK